VRAAEDEPRAKSSSPGGPPGRAAGLTLPQLVLIFVRTGSLAFGGGGSTLAMLHSEFCLQRRVLSDDEFQLFFGLSRLVPGMNLLSLTVLLGYRFHGLIGAVLCLLGLTVPSFSLILLGCQVLRGSHPGPVLQGLLRGLSVGAAALLVTTVWNLSRGSLMKLAPHAQSLWLLLLAGGFLLGRAEVVNPAWIVLGGGALGVLLSPFWQEPSE
jgi:chromate transporter